MNAINVSPIETALQTAKSNGLKSPKLRAGSFIFSLAPEGGRNFGSIYVKHKDGTYLGKITNGEFYNSAATAQQITELQTVANTLTDSVVAYGRNTGYCGCCGRFLVDPVSVAAGIGPICAEKFGLLGYREQAAEEAGVVKKSDITLDDI